MPVMFGGMKITSPLTNDKLMMGFQSSSITCAVRTALIRADASVKKSHFLSVCLLFWPLPTNPVNTWGSGFTLECDRCCSPFQCYYSKLTFCLLFTDIHIHVFVHEKVKKNWYNTSKKCYFVDEIH